MIDFIPLKNYFYFFINSALCMLLFMLLHTSALKGNEGKVVFFNRVFGYSSLFILIAYIGLRPLSEYYFVDMATYGHIFTTYAQGAPMSDEGDIGFVIFTYIASKLISLQTYFFVCACMYIIPLFVAARRWFPKHYFFVFFMLVCSFSFYTYGVNGMRNGIATSFFILALSYDKKVIPMVFWFALSVLFHKSMSLPLLVFILANFYHNMKFYFIAWLSSIFVSLTIGGFVIGIFASLGFGDDRLNAYLNNAPMAGKFSSTGFRWDFLLYSAIPIIMGYLYIFKFKVTDKFYHKLLKTYLLTNAFWVMVIRANFSNRFAYLSWFLMALVIFYPPFKQNIWDQQFKKIGYLMLGYFAITYVLTVILM